MDSGNKFTFSGLLGRAYLLGLLDVALLLWLLRNTPAALLLGTVINSFLTAICYKADKRAAQHGEWRIPEIHLHLWELFWGWPGGLWAQRKYRHKSAKTEYRINFYLCVILNCTASFLLLRYLSATQLDYFFSQAARELESTVFLLKNLLNFATTGF